MTLIQKLGLAYAAMFFVVALLGYVPWFLDSDGYLFGLFTLDLYDNLLHAGSGVWALIAALVSHQQAVRYFKLFGSVYFLDGFVGLFLGNAFLDFGLLQFGIGDYGLFYNVFANLPHIAIGGVAAYIGFRLARKQ